MTSATNFDTPFDRPHAQQILFLSRLADACEWSAVENEVDELVATKARFKLGQFEVDIGLRPTFIDLGAGVNAAAGACKCPPELVNAVAELASVEGLSVEEMKRVVSFASSVTKDTSFSQKVVERLAETSQVVKMAMALAGKG